MIKVYLKKGRDESLRRFHPWVFSGAVSHIDGNPSEGDVVYIYSAQGEPLAAGHWQIGSIAVRILSFEGDPDTPDFYKEALGRALEMRRSLDIGDTNCYRLVHGEGDFLPGLIIDYYDGVCVLQAHSVGMFRSKGRICEALKEIYGSGLKAVYDKSSLTAPFKAGLELVDGYLYKADGFDENELSVKENGHLFTVNWCEGQKTGFFLDQRNNRKLVESLSKGRNVLNLFCYTGGFSVYAREGGAATVCSVDSSAKAIALCERNLGKCKRECPCENVCDDAMDFLSRSEDGAYNLMIVDPPAFAKHRGALPQALRAYRKLNAGAISKVASGGYIFTFSCSQVVDSRTFLEMVFSAAASTGRKVRILSRLTQGEDHPVNIYHPEGEYLKGLLLYVE